MKVSRVAFAIIKKQNNVDEYLMQWNANWKGYSFVGGHYEDFDGDIERTIIREIQEELPPIQWGQDFTVNRITNSPFSTIHFSKRTSQMTEYFFELYQLFFIKPLTTFEFLWDQDKPNVWVNEYEILKGITKTDLPISVFPVHFVIEHINGGLISLPVSG